MRRWAAVCSGLLAAGCASVAPPPLHRPAAEVLPGWQEFVLPGKRSTRYWAGWEGPQRVVHARADASASMLRRQARVAA